VKSTSRWQALKPYYIENAKRVDADAVLNALTAQRAGAMVRADFETETLLAGADSGRICLIYPRFVGIPRVASRCRDAVIWNQHLRFCVEEACASQLAYTVPIDAAEK